MEETVGWKHSLALPDLRDPGQLVSKSAVIFKTLYSVRMDLQPFGCSLTSKHSPPLKTLNPLNCPSPSPPLSLEQINHTSSDKMCVLSNSSHRQAFNFQVVHESNTEDIKPRDLGAF